MGILPLGEYILKVGLSFGVFGGDYMQVLAKTEYQDVYRVTDGVLLIVNKF